MRLLIDEDVDVRLIGVLRRWGHEVKFPPAQSAEIIHVEIHPPRLAAMVSSLKTLLVDIPASAFGGRLFVLDETGYSEFS